MAKTKVETEKVETEKVETEKVETGTPIKLKLARKHPKKEMRLGRHFIGIAPKIFYLDEKELEELKTAGCRHWFEIID